MKLVEKCEVEFRFENWRDAQKWEKFCKKNSDITKCYTVNRVKSSLFLNIVELDKEDEDGIGRMMAAADRLTELEVNDFDVELPEIKRVLLTLDSGDLD